MNIRFQVTPSSSLTRSQVTPPSVLAIWMSSPLLTPSGTWKSNFSFFLSEKPPSSSSIDITIGKESPVFLFCGTLTSTILACHGASVTPRNRLTFLALFAPTCLLYKFSHTFPLNPGINF